ncbi:PREDICTED: E3 ubiquitin-protein ligase TRIM71-like [Amphimedon queenslandica]|nr:PREDICTED: E3 ubiquitin-protein ligase TRIM71-like [Amphimedon queenslandica]|eukprot:XP_011403912.1 PREDICTED: E3 ubiquitin-protein ligase TRIM71-like [Amphimedon queenslandica]
MDGYRIASVGEEGSGPLQFKDPGFIAISPVTGKVYIADVGNHRIQVLNPDLSFSHSFGSEGSADGQFKYPRDVAFDNQGLVYVADTENHRIQKFSPYGSFVDQFGSKGSELTHPVCITVDTAPTGLVYVSEESNHRVSVFTSDGVFITSFGKEGSNINQFNSPHGLMVDKDGFLYVCDSLNGRLVVY